MQASKNNLAFAAEGSKIKSRVLTNCNKICKYVSYNIK